MPVQFILGRSGTGKTKSCLDDIINKVKNSPEGAPLVFLVPEQATFQMEYSLATASGITGSIRAQVLSFRRLAFHVLSETGGAARIPIGELGKRMIIRELLETNKPDLRIFGKSAGRSGFTDNLARVIGEMKTYLVSPGNLKQITGALGDNSVMLSDKLSDTAFLYEELNNHLAARYTDPDDYLTLLAANLGKSKIFKNAEFWIDGFKGFTPQEYAVIEKISKIAAKVNVSLCIEPELINQEVYEDNVFYPTWHTYQKINELTARNLIPVEPPFIPGEGVPVRFYQVPDISYLENNFFRYPAPPANFDEHNIRLVSGANKRTEIEACARQIIRLAREKGYRWRDMALVLRDLEPYHELIAGIFQDYDIPCFIDRKRNVMHHPLIELIRSALEIAIKNWPYEAVFRYLKTDLVPIAREQIYLLENYVLAHGIKGSKWTDKNSWSYRKRYTLGEDSEITDLELNELERVNRARKEAIASLAAFCSNMQKAVTVREKTTALYSLLGDLKAGDTLAAWIEKSEMAGETEKAREHAQVWGNVINLFDELVEALDEKELSIETYLSILDSGFENMTIGLIPPGIDQVVVGSLDRSRNPDVKAAFILGAGEGMFPARIADDGIFTDSDREKLENLGITLAPGGRQRAFEEQFLVYTALTRAGNYLWVSYPEADEEGRSISPSPVICRIKELLPGLTPIRIQAVPESTEEGANLELIAHKERALDLMIARIGDYRSGRDIHPLWWNVYNWYLASGYQDKIRNLTNAVFHENRENPLDADTSRAIYGTPVKASVSRIERFMACPFAHFSAYGLRLRDRNIFRLEAPDMGEFFHAALKNFGEKLNRENRDWGQLTLEECTGLSNEISEELAPQLQSEILLSTARYRYLTGKLKKNISRAVIMLSHHARQSSFRPVGLELGFGPGEQLPPVTIDLPEGDSLQLRGRIDRLDLAPLNETAYLRVIDYKSSDNDIKLPEVYHGLRLQLLTYLQVALANYNLPGNIIKKPAGLHYFTVKEPLINSDGPLSRDELEKKIKNALKMKGYILDNQELFKMTDNQAVSASELFPVRIKKDGSFYATSPVLSEDQFSLLGNHLKKVFTNAGREILQGKVDIAPYRYKKKSACEFCNFKPVCKIDALLEGNKYRQLKDIPLTEIWGLFREKEGPK